MTSHESTWSESRVFVLVLNWNNWPDTVRCLETLFHNDYKASQVIVIDNGSTDDSVERIKAWASGHLSAEVSADDPLRDIISPGVPKPLSLTYLTMEETKFVAGIPETPVILLETGENLGFAGGNNIGLRYVFRNTPDSYAFVLGNDAAVPSHFLSIAMESMTIGEARTVSVLGFPQYDYSNPGKLNVVFFEERFTRGPIHLTEIPPQVSGSVVRGVMVHGGAMLFSPDSPVKEFPEDYFLYYEDADLCNRVHLAGGVVAVQLSNPVYERGGGSTGRGSPLQIYYTRRNKLIYSRRYHSWYEHVLVLCRMVLSTTLSLLKCAIRGDRVKAKAYALALGDYLRGRNGKSWPQD